MKRNNSLNLPFRLVKLIDIGYITAIYFILGLICAFILNNIFEIDNYEEYRKKRFLIILLEIIGILWLNGVIIYISRNLVGLIPSPFNGLYGLKHNIVSELKDATIFVFVIIYFQYSLRQRINYLYYLVSKKSLIFTPLEDISSS